MRYMHRAVLADNIWDNRQNYAMEFTINIKKLGNEGNSSRPIAIIIPRSKDRDFNEYYAITYFMENTISNQFVFKWAIINTAAPTKMEPLVENYYLLREDLDYTARLLINNTQGNMNIKFYIDGPINPMQEYKPLLEYTDDTDYKILSGVRGPALGTIGYSDSFWGIFPVINYDNIRLYTLDQYKKYEEELNKNYQINPYDIVGHNNYDEIKYLLNWGLFEEYPDHSFKVDKNVSVLEFLKTLLRIKDGKTKGLDDEAVIKRGLELGIIKDTDLLEYKGPLTRYNAALIINRFIENMLDSQKNKSFIKGFFSIIEDILGVFPDKSLASFIRDYEIIPEKYLNAVVYVFYEGYLRLDEDFEYNGDNLISRSDLAKIILRIMDKDYRQVNYSLELPDILSSGAVLQRDKKIPIWGKGITGDTITVKFKKQHKSAIVKKGYWYLELNPEPYGGPYTLTISSTKEKIELEDIMVGEVFIVAGQSNAEMYLLNCYNMEETREKFLNSPALRFYSGEQITSVRSNFNNTGNWEYAYDYALDYSSAIGTFFVDKLLELNPELRDLTIGVIHMTYGGTSIEAFMPISIVNEKNYVPEDNEPIMSGFWNGFMAPVAPYAVKALMYYQGENSAHLGYEYEALLRDYLRGIRIEFKDPQLSIMLVQLAGFGYHDYKYNNDEWPIIREIQQKVADSTDYTGLVTAVDLSDPDPLEIHPKEKKKIGKRLAYLGMNLIYGKADRGSSAKLKYSFLKSNEVLLFFEKTFGRLYFKEGVQKDIQVLDDSWEWYMANAEIYSSNAIRVWHDDIKDPIAVRYAWVNNPEISLYNKLDYPVLPFKVILKVKTTGERLVKIKNHTLKPDDAIVNTTRNNIGCKTCLSYKKKSYQCTFFNLLYFFSYCKNC
jgi:hypothetical protein